MSKQQEKVFEFLRRKENGEKYDSVTVKNWYIARSYVLDRLKDVSYDPDSNDHLHVVLLGDTPLMLCIARQVALSAHYFNFKEDNEDESQRNRTVITLISKKNDIRNELEKEEFLCNLPKFCKFVDRNSEPENKDSFIDIEIHIVDDYLVEKKGNNELVFTKEDVEAFYKSKMEAGIDIFSIDTRKAIFAKRIYGIGSMIDNLPAEDIYNSNRYALALDVFQYETLKAPLKPLMSEGDMGNLNRVRENLSNIFCSDCFETRLLGIQRCCNGNVNKQNWREFNKTMSKSEHARWVVERLIMGYSPLDSQQRFKDESLSCYKKKREQYRKQLKYNSLNPVHIDICSYADLRCINPEDLKYDSFLMLAIPIILEKVRDNE